MTPSSDGWCRSCGISEPGVATVTSALHDLIRTDPRTHETSSSLSHEPGDDLHLEVEHLSDGVLIDPISTLLRRLMTINASDHTWRIPDAVRDCSATPALVRLAPRGAARGFTRFVHGSRSNSVASGVLREVVLFSLGAWPWSARLHRAFAWPDEHVGWVEL
jgi:hypothetical protein